MTSVTTTDTTYNGFDMAEKISLKYPVLFLHGFGCGDKKREKYWGRIPSVFEQAGCMVFFARQEGGAVTEDNAVMIKESIQDILKQTGAGKVNIIAHSKGGLEARYLISSLGMADKVASLTTIGTPHHGSLTLDKIPKFMLKPSAFFTHIGMRIAGDKHPQVYKVFISFRESEMKKFNLENPDSPLVYYQSYAFCMNHSFLLWLPHTVVSLYEGENDGLVTSRSAEWGDFKGVVKANNRRGISHMDEVDNHSRRLTKKIGEGISDILEVYKEILNTLYQKGF